jgi:hypothetical protein
VFLNPGNEADGNVYVGLPDRFQGYGEGDVKQYVDLAAWRHAHGWDTNSVWPMRTSISTRTRCN